MEMSRQGSENRKIGGDTLPKEQFGQISPTVATKLGQFAWMLLAYTSMVLIFGAFVRASYSGDGCGTYWPTCGGVELVPTINSTPRVVEFTHRLTSLLLILGTAALYFVTFRKFSKGSVIRKAAGWAAFSTVISALIGAVLVLARWVTNDKSIGRAVTMPLHLMNNFILLASLALVAAWLTGTNLPTIDKLKRKDSQLKSALGWIFGSMFLLGASGAFSALGKTAFEHELSFAKGFAERMLLHVGPKADPLLRGGVFHPLIATSIGLLIVWMCGMVSQLRPAVAVRKFARISVGLYVGQMLIGVVNLVASAPIPLQLMHLGLAIANWVTLVLMAVHALGATERSVDTVQESALEIQPEPSAGAYAGMSAQKATWKDYLALTKPRVISLLLFTTVAAMFVGSHGIPPLFLLLAVCIGGYASAGSANAFNMVIEEDLDKAMERTSHRPTVSHVISKKNALIFAFALGLGSFALLWAAANLLTAVMALSGLLCYVFVYTLWLKRRTWQNIVIGGAAGAFPPLVGYAAVTGYLSPLAWYMFAVILLWTPVHFWALALLIKDDYAKAGVPMLPVVRGDRVTVNQIGIYALLTAVISVLPFVQGQAGITYLIGSSVLNLGLIAQALKLWKTIDKPHARALFKFSMAHLALFFIIVAVDQARWI